jgi:hypothetical protein
MRAAAGKYLMGALGIEVTSNLLTAKGLPIETSCCGCASSSSSFAMMSIYEFAGGRIRRDWGILARASWTD